ncbi:MAG: undecaprenyldiphospho-muramoylpentapeptide beta-N-acetylglucosaminyltransferase [Candidatus Melainabacteria bacterium]|nr:MAG: undecaprenyldiphospho-muramoylpentapeptide beta-N-acetylglucosaminyltransferase [Candidatus Melainabacteria bacterium]
MSFRHRIILTGGGTGGHIYPALAVAEQLKADESVEAILYIGAKGHLEEKLAREKNLEFVGLSVSGLPRQLSGKLVTWPFQFFNAVNAARKEIDRFQPTAVLGTGGYASAPPLMAALLAHKKVAIHEPDAHPGLANRVFARFARLISLGMGQASENFAQKDAWVVVNGNPVSERFLMPPNRTDALRQFGLAENKTTILVTGGSQGAVALNKAIYDLLPMVQQDNVPLQILHQVGEKNWQALQANLDGELLKSSFYKPRPYFDRLEIAYAASDLTVCRAGAMTIAELFVSGMPAIFVPYPFAAQDHQTFNARYVEAQGGAQVIPQSELTGRRLYEAIVALHNNADKLARMKRQMLSLARPRAAVDLTEQLLRMSRQQSSSTN